MLILGKAAGVLQKSLVAMIATSNVPRTNYAYGVGMQFTTGPAPLTVSALGRWVLAGDTLPIDLHLWLGDHTPVIEVTLDPSASPPGQFAYVAITPVTLSASTFYFLFFTPPATGSDPWLDDDSTLSFSSDISSSNIYSVYRDSGGGFNAYTHNGCYGPMDLKYS